MAALSTQASHLSCVASLVEARRASDPSGSLSTPLPPSSLSFAQNVSHSLALTPTPYAVSRAQGHTLVVRAERGTQLFKWGGGGGGTEKGKGTIIIRGGKKDGSQKQKGTRKITTSIKPEEISAARGGLLDTLLRPFASLFGGRQTDPKTVFVAGPTGVTGSRVVLELLSSGFTVRAGVSDVQSAQGLADLASQFRQLVSADDARRLNFVQCDLEDVEFTAKAIANAGKVVVALGSEENGPKSNITPSDALSLLEAAKIAKAPFFVLITDFSSASNSGNSGGGLFGAVFGFFANLTKKGVSYSELLSEIVESSVGFTVIRTGSSKGVADSVGDSRSVVLGPEGKFSGGSVSRLEVASVVAEVLSNVSASQNKVVDVVAKEGVEAPPLLDQLKAIPLDGRRTSKEAARAKAEAEEKEREFREAAEAETRAVAAEARAAAQSLAALESEARRVAAEEAKAAAAEVKAKERAQAASATVSDIANTLKEVSSNVRGTVSGAVGDAKSALPSFSSLVPDIPPPTPSSVAAAAQAAAAAAQAAVSKRTGGGGEGEGSGTTKQRRALRQRSERKAGGGGGGTEKEKVAVVKAAAPPAERKKEKLLGVFEQETIYLDPDEGM